MTKKYTSSILKTVITTAFFLAISMVTNAQNCFEIRSILADACGAPEGENEMVRFDIGPNDLLISDLNINWPNPAISYKGICQDTATASKVDSLNQGIVGCGYLIEPTGGILPANSKVLLVTSTNFNTSFNSFANLNDTLIIIFQCYGNTNGHFANYNSVPAVRTLIMNFGTCYDSISYDRSLLVNQAGGHGGSSTFNDGALVTYDSAGNATYLNYGCQALVNAINVAAGTDRIFCTSATINLYGNVSGAYTSLQWSGGAGSFNPPNSAATSYVTTIGETGWVPLWLTATGSCGTSTTDTLYVYFPMINPDPILSSSGFTLTCSVQSASLGYSWLQNGAPTAGNSYILNAPSTGCYSVIVTDTFGCSVTSDTVCIINAGINDPYENFNVSLQPNPAADVQHLQITSLQNINQLTLQVIDVTGQQLITKKYEVNQNKFVTEVDLSALSKGIYFLKLQMDGKSTVLKVMKE